MVPGTQGEPVPRVKNCYHKPYMRQISVILLGLLLPVAVFASIPEAASDAIVRVVCENRQGSGAIVNATDGYVITGGHIAIDSETGAQAAHCTAELPAGNGRERSAYRADIVRAILDTRTSRDFALLKLSSRIFGPAVVASNFLRINEYAWVGDSVTAFGFPQAVSMFQTASGKITSFMRGTMHTDAPIAEGYSGGPVLDASGQIIGVATRIAFVASEDTSEAKPTDYEMGDILSLINWLDEAGPGEHDKYITHFDSTRFDSAPYVLRDESSVCDYVVFVEGSTSLSCLFDSHQRLVFPNEATFKSWYPDFSNVLRATTEQISQYRLIGNMTMRPGTLVKIQTDPKIYIVTDSFGTMRWVQTEPRAAELFGAGWAKLISDIPEVFFTDYKVARPIL